MFEYGLLHVFPQCYLDFLKTKCLAALKFYIFFNYPGLWDNSFKNIVHKNNDDQAIEHLLSWYEALSSNLSTAKKKKIHNEVEQVGTELLWGEGGRSVCLQNAADS
jgi:hypothetical protein